MIGVQDEQVDHVLDLIRQEARSRSQTQDAGEVQTAAATVFVLDLEEYQRLERQFPEQLTSRRSREGGR